MGQALMALDRSVYQIKVMHAKRLIEFSVFF